MSNSRPSAFEATATTTTPSCTSKLIASGVCYKIIIAVLVAILLIGPILVIIGFVLLMIPPLISEEVAAYNAAGQNYTMVMPTLRLMMVSLTSSSPSSSASASGDNNTDSGGGGMNVTVPLSRFIGSIPVVGSPPGLQAFRSLSFQVGGGALPSSLPKAAVTMINTRGVESTPWTPAAFLQPLHRTMSISVNCTVDQCDIPKAGCACSSIELLQYCTNAYGGLWLQSRLCKDGEFCGTCEVPSRAQYICVPFSLQGSSESPVIGPSSKGYEGCYYPFHAPSALLWKQGGITSGGTGAGGTTSPRSSSSSIETYSSFYSTLILRDENDPFIVLQRLTRGTLDFGWDGFQQNLAGSLCLALGMILFLVGIVGACMMYRLYAALRAIMELESHEVAVMQGRGENGNGTLGNNNSPVGSRSPREGGGRTPREGFSVGRNPLSREMTPVSPLSRNGGARGGSTGATPRLSPMNFMNRNPDDAPQQQQLLQHGSPTVPRSPHDRLVVAIRGPAWTTVVEGSPVSAEVPVLPLVWGEPQSPSVSYGQSSYAEQRRRSSVRPQGGVPLAAVEAMMVADAQSTEVNNIIAGHPPGHATEDRSPAAAIHIGATVDDCVPFGFPPDSVA